jgi:hypothetical protein
VGPRGPIEEGGPFMCRFVLLGEFCWGTLVGGNEVDLFTKACNEG